MSKHAAYEVSLTREEDSQTCYVYRGGNTLTGDVLVKVWLPRATIDGKPPKHITVNVTV